MTAAPFGQVGRRLLAAVLVALGAATLMTVSASPAHAAFVQATYQCWPGPSGNACARLYYDASTRAWRAYGAVDPNSGKSIVLRRVALIQCSTPSGGCNLISATYGSGPGSVYQRLTTDGRGPACYWYADIEYSVGGSNYLRASPIGGLC